MTLTGRHSRPGRARLHRALLDSGVMPAAWSPPFEAVDRTTIEVDPAVADAAEKALHAHGLYPTVITGDGLGG
ncbi:hypothetical protein [Embleya sp. MST-111070]|uniref:hypothetical protein n=1 Tax=Embleya sp. MST-111070 TaxID=3398231 RepID=UPI003F7406D6